jgi:hypothetical protein
MSKISEYIQMVKKGLPHLEHVIEGISNNVMMEFGALPDSEKEEIIRRRLICEECPLNSRNAQTSEEYVLLFNTHYKTDRKDFHCSICTCPIKTKTASLESNCGLEVYNNQHPTNKQPLFWTKYNT